jgi:hypothetical protein
VAGKLKAALSRLHPLRGAERQREDSDQPDSKEWFRAEMVGEVVCEPDGHLMTDEEFEVAWAKADFHLARASSQRLLPFKFVEHGLTGSYEIRGDGFYRGRCLCGWWTDAKSPRDAGEELEAHCSQAAARDPRPPLPRPIRKVAGVLFVLLKLTAVVLVVLAATKLLGAWAWLLWIPGFVVVAVVGAPWPET